MIKLITNEAMHKINPRFVYFMQPWFTSLDIFVKSTGVSGVYYQKFFGITIDDYSVNFRNANVYSKRNYFLFCETVTINFLDDDVPDMVFRGLTFDDAELVKRAIKA